jgi:predicted CXXCH cytochrome family protein
MNNRSARSLLFLITAILFLSTVFAYRAFAQADIRIDPAASCTASCHTDFAKKKHIHPPAESGNDCASMCHEPVKEGKHAFKPMPANKTEVCTMCHAQPVAAHQHPPAQAGLCTTCHNPHQSDHARLLRKPVPELCFTCHEPAKFKGKVVHGPVAEGNCVGCHAPHSAKNKPLLDKTSPELCFGCHAAQLKDAQGRMLPAIKSLFDDKEATLHPPFAAGECSFCHQPHTSEQVRLLAEAYPADFYASFSEKSYGLCFTCHSSSIFEAPRTLAETNFRNGNLNLHYRHVNRDKGRTCSACHSPHGSRQPKLINPVFQFGGKVLPLKYEKTETGGSCAGACHVPVNYDRCDPAEVNLRTTPRTGRDATPEELKKSCEKQK